jgi:hypothetical protein
MTKKRPAKKLKPQAVIEKLGHTREEAALALGISVGSVDNLTERGLLHPSRALRRPIYSKPDLLAFLANTTGELNLD